MSRQSRGTTLKPSNGRARSSSFYGDALGNSLREEHEALLSAPPDEQTRLDNELALLKMSARDAVAVWASAEGTKRLVAAQLMEEKIEGIARMVTAIVRNNAQNAISVHQLHFAMRQMISIAFEVMPHETARQFEMMVSQRVSINSGPEGTTLTPDQDAIDMDRTVPLTA